MLRYGWENFHLAWLSSDSLYEALWWRIGRHIVKGDDGGDPALIKWVYGFDSGLLPGLVIPKTVKKGVIPACMIFRMK